MKHAHEQMKVQGMGTVEWFIHDVDGSRAGVSSGDCTSLESSQHEELGRVRHLWALLGDAAAGKRLAEPFRDEPKEGTCTYRQWLQATEYIQPDVSEATTRALFLPLAACVAAVAIALGAYLNTKYLFTRLPSAEVTQSYATLAAQTRKVILPDGSQLTLGSQTELSVRYTSERRVIDLVKGEALFSVAHDASRPFTVFAGAGSITAVGTQFDVTRDPDERVDRVTVVVKEGTVEIAPPETDQPTISPQVTKPRVKTWSPTRVKQGQGISYDAAGPQGEVAQVDIDAASAWADGRLEYKHTALKIVIPRISRFSEKPILLADPAVGEIPFTGSVFLGQVKGWLKALPTVYPVQVAENSDHIEIRSLPDASDK
jgi:transmembrane sensor